MTDIDVVLYTDGSTRPQNPGPAGWAALAVWPDGHEVFRAQGRRHSTNNRAELNAAAMGLEMIWEERGAQVVHAVSDSKYIIDGITTYLPVWVANKWMTSNGKPVANKDLWELLSMVHDLHTMVYWDWTKGHAKESSDQWSVHSAYNDRVDKLAAQEALYHGGSDVNE